MDKFKDKLENISKNFFKKSEIKKIQKTFVEKFKDSDEDDLLTYLYDLSFSKTKEEFLEKLNNTKIGWNNVEFDELRFNLEEQDDFIMNPFEVEEGILECKKCKSKKVFSFSKQVRSSDEPTTIFNECVKCKSKWTCGG